MTTEVDHTFHYLKKAKDPADPIYDQYRGLWALNPLNHYVGDYPIHLDIETTTVCNLKCKMCFQSFDPPEPKVMHEQLVYDLIDEICGEVYSIKLQYRGEPLTDNRIPKFVRYAKRHGITEVMFNTNANLLTEAMAEELIMSGLDKIICSVEGSNAQVYNETRIGGDFDVVVGNIKALVKMRNSWGYDKPKVRVQMVKTESNSSDVHAFLGFWKDIADEVAVEDELDYHADKPDYTPLDDWACPQLYQRMIVLADGDIVPCCRGVSEGSTKMMVLGNAYEDKIGDVWTNAKARLIRELHESGLSHQLEMCARCGLRKSVVRKHER